MIKDTNQLAQCSPSGGMWIKSFAWWLQGLRWSNRNAICIDFASSIFKYRVNVCGEFVEIWNSVLNHTARPGRVRKSKKNLSWDATKGPKTTEANDTVFYAGPEQLRPQGAALIPMDSNSKIGAFIDSKLSALALGRWLKGMSWNMEQKEKYMGLDPTELLQLLA